MGDSAIEWTDKVWNPVTGCTKVSAGCKHCYAERIFHRPYPGRDFSDVQCHPERLDQPLRWRKPKRVFVNSMSDLFHEAVPDEFIAAVFGVMAQAERHTFQILTKRPARMREWIDWIDERPGHAGHPGDAARDIAESEYGVRPDKAPYRYWPLPNVWLGVSVEDKETYRSRIIQLANTPAAIRFVSFEPLLGDVGDLALDGLVGGCLDWAIVGGESGPKARPMHPDWVRSLRDQCVAADVPFFFKQWGEWAPVIQGLDRVGKKKAGRLLDGREWNQFPEVTP